MSQRIKIFTDGSALDNSKTSCAGYAYCIPKLNICDGGFMMASNNVAELTAVLKALTTLFQLKYLIKEKNIEIITDSKYVITVIDTDKDNAKVNRDLVFAIRNLKSKLIENDFNICFSHVNSHLMENSLKQETIDSDNSEYNKRINKLVDEIAVGFAKNKGNYKIICNENKLSFKFN